MNNDEYEWIMMNNDDNDDEWMNNDDEWMNDDDNDE